MAWLDATDAHIVLKAPPSPRQRVIMRKLRARAEGSIWRIDRHRALDVEDALHHARVPKTEAFEDTAYSVRYGGPPEQVQYALAVKSGLETPKIQLPTLSKPLYGYQEHAVRFLHAAGSGILADEPGLGKTLQGIAFALLDARPALIVCPATAKHVWQDELHAAGHSDVQIIQGRAPVNLTARFIVINYDVLDAHEDALAAHGFGTMVADEVHRAKNIRARRTKSLVRLADCIQRRMLLSGTLMMNSAEDLWPPLRMLRPGSYPDFRAFRERYTTSRQVTQIVRGRKVRKTVHEGSCNLVELHDRMAPFTIRRTLRDVRDEMPEVRHTILRIDLPPSLASQYKERATKAKAKLGASRDPALLLEASRTLIDVCVEAKAMFIRNWLAERDVPDRKSLLFSTRLALLDAAEAPLPEAIRIDGAVPTKTRQALVRQFQDPSGPAWFLGQTRACGEALTLDAADTVVIAEADWSPQANEQAIRRALRVKTHHGLEVIWLVVKDTLDEARMDVLQRKQAEFGAVMDGVEPSDVLATAMATLDA